MVGISNSDFKRRYAANDTPVGSPIVTMRKKGLTFRGQNPVITTSPITTNPEKRVITSRVGEFEICTELDCADGPAMHTIKKDGVTVGVTKTVVKGEANVRVGAAPVEPVKPTLALPGVAVSSLKTPSVSPVKTATSVSPVKGDKVPASQFCARENSKKLSPRSPRGYRYDPFQRTFVSGQQTSAEVKPTDTASTDYNPNMGQKSIMESKLAAPQERSNANKFSMPQKVASQLAGSERVSPVSKTMSPKHLTQTDGPRSRGPKKFIRALGDDDRKFGELKTNSLKAPQLVLPNNGEFVSNWPENPETPEIASCQKLSPGSATCDATMGSPTFDGASVFSGLNPPKLLNFPNMTLSSRKPFGFDAARLEPLGKIQLVRPNETLTEGDASVSADGAEVPDAGGEEVYKPQAVSKEVEHDPGYGHDIGDERFQNDCMPQSNVSSFANIPTRENSMSKVSNISEVLSAAGKTAPRLNNIEKILESHDSNAGKSADDLTASEPVKSALSDSASFFKGIKLNNFTSKTAALLANLEAMRGGEKSGSSSSLLSMFASQTGSVSVPSNDQSGSSADSTLIETAAGKIGRKMSPTRGSIAPSNTQVSASNSFREIWGTDTLGGRVFEKDDEISITFQQGKAFRQVSPSAQEESIQEQRSACQQRGNPDRTTSPAKSWESQTRFIPREKLQDVAAESATSQATPRQMQNQMHTPRQMQNQMQTLCGRQGSRVNRNVDQTTPADDQVSPSVPYFAFFDDGDDGDLSARKKTDHPENRSRSTVKTLERKSGQSSSGKNVKSIDENNRLLSPQHRSSKKNRDDAVIEGAMERLRNIDLSRLGEYAGDYPGREVYPSKERASNSTKDTKDIADQMIKANIPMLQPEWNDRMTKPFEKQDRKAFTQENVKVVIAETPSEYELECYRQTSKLHEVVCALKLNRKKVDVAKDGLNAAVEALDIRERHYKQAVRRLEESKLYSEYWKQAMQPPVGSNEKPQDPFAPSDPEFFTEAKTRVAELREAVSTFAAKVTWMNSEIPKRLHTSRQSVERLDRLDAEIEETLYIVSDLIMLQDYASVLTSAMQNEDLLEGKTKELEALSHKLHEADKQHATDNKSDLQSGTMTSRYSETTGALVRNDALFAKMTPRSSRGSARKSSGRQPMVLSARSSVSGSRAPKVSLMKSANATAQEIAADPERLHKLDNEYNAVHRISVTKDYMEGRASSLHIERKRFSQTRPRWKCGSWNGSNVESSVTPRVGEADKTRRGR